MPPLQTKQIMKRKRTLPDEFIIHKHRAHPYNNMPKISNHIQLMQLEKTVWMRTGDQLVHRHEMPLQSESFLAA